MKIIYSDKISLTSFRVMLALVFLLANCVTSVDKVYRCYWKLGITYGDGKFPQRKLFPITNVEELDKAREEVATPNKHKKKQELQQNEYESLSTQPPVFFDLLIDEKNRVKINIEDEAKIRFYPLSSKMNEDIKRKIMNFIESAKTNENNDCPKNPEYLTFIIQPQDRMLCHFVEQRSFFKESRNFGVISNIIEDYDKSMKLEEHCITLLLLNEGELSRILNYNGKGNVKPENNKIDPKSSTGNKQSLKAESNPQKISKNDLASKQASANKTSNSHANTGAKPIGERLSKVNSPSGNNKKSHALSQKSKLSKRASQSPKNKSIVNLNNLSPSNNESAYIYKQSGIDPRYSATEEIHQSSQDNSPVTQAKRAKLDSSKYRTTEQIESKKQSFDTSLQNANESSIRQDEEGDQSHDNKGSKVLNKQPTESGHIQDEGRYNLESSDNSIREKSIEDLVDNLRPISDNKDNKPNVNGENEQIRNNLAVTKLLI